MNKVGDIMDLTENQKPVNYKFNLAVITIGRLVSNLGTSVFNFALSLYVLDITGSAQQFSMILILSILPSIFINLGAGVFVDRSNKKTTMVITEILSGILVLYFWVLFRQYPASVVLIMICTLVLSTVQAFFRLALNASIPDLVSTDNVTRTNSIFQGIGSIINIIGPILGAILYKTINMDLIFVINGVSFILSGISELFLQYIRRNLDTCLEKRSYWEEIKKIYSYLNQNVIMEFFLVFAFIGSFFFYPLILLVIRYIGYNIFKLTGLQVSIIQAAWAVGTIIGALVLSLKNWAVLFLRRFVLLLTLQAFLLIFWLFPKLSFFDEVSNNWIVIIYCFILAVMGVLNTLQIVSTISYFQVSIPENLRARAFGVISTALLASSPLGYWIYGILLEKVNWMYIVIVSWICLLSLSAFAKRSKVMQDFMRGL